MKNTIKKSFICAFAALATLAASAFDTPYLTFRSVASFSLSATKRWDGTLQKATSNPTDEASWSDWTGTSITAGLSDGQYYIYLRGKDNTHINSSSGYGSPFTLSGATADLYCEGDIETLRDYEGNPPNMDVKCYAYLFNEWTRLVSPPMMSATTLAEDCYRNMFEGCTALKSIPALPATTAPNRCYYYMFKGCTSLEVNTTAPGVEWAIPSGTVGTSIWNYDMFANTSGSFTGNPVAGTTYYIASALPFGEIYQIPGKGTLDLALVGFSANVDLSSTVKNGTAPYTFAHVGGTLPPGLNVSGSTLLGTPTTTGNYSFSISVTDADSHTLASAAYTMQVVQPTVTATTFVGADGSTITTNCITLTTAMTTLNQAWYVASGTLNYGTGGIKVSGDVNLVLANGASMTVQGAAKKAGVNVAPGNSLTIYGQLEGTGTLNASGNSSDGFDFGGAGIGGNDSESCGTVTINGGTITANGAEYTSAGIGGGKSGNGGTVTINGGTVTATGGEWFGAGIGGGQGGNGGTVTINGGTVTATAGSSSAGTANAATGIGRGYGYAPTAGTLTVGPTMSVKAGSTANPTEEIGRGGTITIGTQQYFVVETAGLVLETSALAAYTNESKNWNLADTISGGTTPYSFTPVAGFEPPSGLTLSGTTLSGSVAAANTYTIKYTVMDSSATPLVLDAVYTLTVTAPDPITETQTTLAATVGKFKSFTLADTISGGVPSYTFALASGSNAPDGFSLTDGVLSGTAASAVASYSFTVVVTDALGTTKNVTYTFTAVESTGFTDDDPEEPESGDSVNCRTADGMIHQRTCTLLTSSSTVWNNSWYYVAPNTTLSIAGVVVSNKVSLVLGDGATLTVQGGDRKAGIRVVPGNTLSIYCQGVGTGVLNATGGSGGAGIGGDNAYSTTTGEISDCGKVNIYGGVITASGNGDGAGIGGGDGYGKGGTINIYGGTVTATPGRSATGIGGGYNGAGGNVTIEGGSVTASSKNASYAGIGGANGKDQGTLKVGANVVVKADTTTPLTDDDIREPDASGYIDLATLRLYYLVEYAGPTPITQTVNAFAAYVGDAFEVALTSTVSGGTPSYTFVQKSGTLPTGLSFANGVISGAPVVAGSASVVYTVTDSGSPAQSTDFAYTFTVTPKPKKITYYNGAVEITGLTPTNYVEGTVTALAASAPAATGYEFAGWYGNSGLTGDPVSSISAVATGDQEFWAKFTPIVYTVTYMDGSTPITDQGLTPTNYTIESAALTLPATATKSGYGFYGWYTNSACTGSAVTTIPADSTGNMSFYAKWGAVKVNTPYVDAKGNAMPEQLCAVVTSETTTLETGWYVVNGEVTINSPITVSGDVKLILADNCRLVVNATGAFYAAINVSGENALTIYSQTLGTGALEATGGSISAGIGGSYYTPACGTIIINGGTVTATAPNGGAGIGGGYDGNNNGLSTGGSITINGGTVTAIGNAAGIGGGGGTPAGAGGTVVVNGGTVVATGGSSRPGIGGGTTSVNQGTLTVGSKVVVRAGSSENPTTVLNPNRETDLTSLLTGQRYFTFETMVLAQAETDLAAYAGEAFELSLAATISGGVPTYSFSGLTPNNLGLTLTSGGLLSGTLAAGVYNLALTVTDSELDSINASYTLTVSNRPKSITYKDGETTLTGLTPTNYVEGTITALAPSAPAAAGYAFAGWYDNAGLSGSPVTAISAVATGDQTFWASWTTVVYTVTYMMDSTTPITDQGLVPTSYTIESATQTLPATATKSGYGFYGWYTDSACSGSAVTTIPSGSTGNKTFYAKWGAAKSMEYYVDASGNVMPEVECEAISSETTTLGSGWYVVKGEVPVNHTITVDGDAKLILADNCLLSVTGSSSKAGICVAAVGSVTNSLTIYCQSAGNGVLSSTGGHAGAGIGGNNDTYRNCGSVTIHGGVINATGASSGDAAGIGGGDNGGSGGTVTIYGGTVTATTGSKYGASGIGGGYNGVGGNVAIYGGKVIATASPAGIAPYAGIGGKNGLDQGSLTVGPSVLVKAGSNESLTDSDIQNPNGETVISLTTVYRYYDVGLAGPTLLRQTTSEITAYVDEAFELALSNTVSGGTAPYSFAAVSGTLPDGLVFNAGVIAGTPTVATPAGAVVYTVTDSGIGSDAQNTNFTYTITVTSRPKAITYMDGVVELTGLVPAEYVEGTGATLPATATKTGYTFDGWYGNSGLAGDAVTAIGTEATGPQTFWAKWTAVEYTITYMDGSTTLTGLAPTNYTVEAAVTLPTPGEKEGYTFAGWRDNSGLSGDEVTGIALGSTGNKTFYAKWTRNPSIPVEVTFVGANGSAQTETCTVLTTDDTELTGWYVVDGDVNYGTSGITVVGAAHIVLLNGSSLRVDGGYGKAGIEVSSGNSLSIYGEFGGTGTLTARGTFGTAGIGGTSDGTVGAITINGGTVVARGGYRAAGIGGGNGRDGGTVTINGGTVTAIGDYASGIGGGYGAESQGTLTIGEYVTVSAGSDSYSTEVKTPDVNGAIALSGEYCYKAVCDRPISVSYRDVDGVDKHASCKLVTADRTVLDGDDSAWYAVTEELNISGGITVTNNVKLILADGVTLGVSGIRAGIEVYEGAALTIYGQAGGTGTLNVTGGSTGAGIGGYSDYNMGAVTINGGTVNATGGMSAAGIGGGTYSNGGTVTINGGTVTATGGSASAAGIGKGAYGSNGSLTVAAGIRVKAGSSADPTAVLNPNGETSITLGGERYYVVARPVLAQTGESQFAAYTGEAFEIALANTIEGGTTPYAFSGLTPDNLGLTLTSGGVLSGTLANGIYNLSLTVTDAASDSIQASYTLVVSARPKTITYMDGENVLTGLIPDAYVEGVGATLPATATKTGYTFDGWYGNSGLTGDPVTAIGAEATGPQTFWAKWTAVEYTITYMDGSTTLTGLAPTNYTIEAVATLPTPSEKEGYTFAGWRDNAELTGSAVTTIPVGSTGNRTFYAKWTRNPGVPMVVTFIDANGSERTETCGVLTEEDTDLGSGWYVVDGTLNFGTGGITVSGDAHLVLRDGSSMTVTGDSSARKPGIEVLAGNSLTIYGESGGTGVLTATGGSFAAGIGSGMNNGACGTVTINGGVVTATGGSSAAGIGGGWRNVNATSDADGNGGTVTINGGTVTATGSFGAAGIGGGDGSNSHGTLTVGEYVTVTAGSSANPTTVKTPGVNGAITLSGERYYKAVLDRPVTVSYRDTDGTIKNVACKVVTADTEVLDGSVSAWYAVTQDLTFSRSLTVSGTVNLILVDDVTLTATGTYSSRVGVGVTAGNALTIYGQANGTGALVASGYSYAAGIGGGQGENCGTVTINGGVITATGDSAAGIGGGSGGAGGTVTVNGGTVTATGDTSTPGIGGSSSHGTLTVGAYMSVLAGRYVDSLTAKQSAANGSVALAGEKIYKIVSNGPVTVSYRDTDGTDKNATCKLVTADASVLDGAICSWYAVTNDLTFSSKNLIISNSVNLILVDGATLEVTNVSYKTAIEVSQGNALTIYGQSAGTGALYATGGGNCAAIGGGRDSADCGTVTINGGVIVATATSLNGAGIGGGNDGAGGTVTINGGTVTATGAGFAAGIGGGWKGSGGIVTINGGTVTATGGDYGAGIGGGQNSDGGAVTVAGGVVTATGGNYSTGIGKGGFGTDNGTLTVAEDITVKAGASANPETVLTRGAGGVVEGIVSQQYFVLVKRGLEPLVLRDGAGTLSDARTGVATTWTLADTIEGGTLPYVFSGDVPAGLTLESDGTLAGTITAAGVYTFTLTVQDSASANQTIEATYTIVARAGHSVTYYDGNTQLDLAPSFYLEGVGLASLPTPAKANYVFVNWFDNSGLSGDPVTAIPADATADIMLYAEWREHLSGVVSMTFVGADGTEQTQNCTVIDETLTELTDGWYVVGNDVTFDGKPLVVSGNVRIVLRDGKTMTVTGENRKAGITVTGEGNSLTIYGQSGNSGALYVTGGQYGAGIGGDQNTAGGAVAIYGGRVFATGGTSGSGIGSGMGIELAQGTLTAGADMDVFSGDTDSSMSQMPHGAGGAITLAEKTYYKVLPVERVVVDYCEADGTPKSALSKIITAETTTLDGGWYAVTNDVTLAWGLTATNAVNLILADGVTLSASGRYLEREAGVMVHGESALTIYGQELGTGTLCATGGTNSAGIGSGYGAVCGSITINGGVIDAVGYSEAAGIGGVRNVAGGTVTINAGTVTARSSGDGAGIGGGMQGSGGVVTITGGSVTAIGGASGAGIGGGSSGGAGGTVTISGGTVVATGGYQGAGIGGGRGGSGGTVSVSGGTVTATAGASASGIGRGYGPSSLVQGTLQVTGGLTVKAGDTEESLAEFPPDATGMVALETRKFYKVVPLSLTNVSYRDVDGTDKVAGCRIVTSTGTTLANGWYAVTNNVAFGVPVTISGNVNLIIADGVSMSATGDKAGISVVAGNSLAIYGQSLGTGTLCATGGTYCAGIGGGDGESCGAVTVNGCTVTAIGDYCGAGIGGGRRGAGGTVTVNNGTVIASCDDTLGAGIGSGDGDGVEIDGGTLIVNGGTVTATGGQYGAGVGGGNNAAGSTVIVNGGMLNARGGSSAAAIGGGKNGAGSTVTVNAGTVVAVAEVESGDGGAAIGGGQYGAGGTVTVNGGSVTATGSRYGAGIGGGKNGAGGTVTISGGTVVATGGMGGAGIGGAGTGNGGTVTITGGTVTATCNVYGTAGIGGGGSSESHGTLTVGEHVVVTAGVDEEHATIKRAVAGAIALGGEQCYYVKTVEPVTVSYRAVDGTEVEVSAMPVIEADAVLSNGWFVVMDDVMFMDGVTIDGDVNLILADDVVMVVSNSVTGAGISVPFGCSLTIYGQELGTGTLEATGSYGPGIGAAEGDCGAVTVNGGNVIATGRYGGAGIGGGRGGNGGTVTVNGGTVVATGSMNCAGIGGGSSGNGGTVTINGGTVTALGGSNGAAGIGGGDQGNGGTVTINGGTVTATGSNLCAGIGGGIEGAGGTVTVNGGTVIATGGNRGAGIGGGSGGSGGTVAINGGTVTATGGELAAGVGRGSTGWNDGSLTLGALLLARSGEESYRMKILPRDEDDSTIVLLDGLRYFSSGAAQTCTITYMDGETPMNLAPASYTEGVGADLPGLPDVTKSGKTFGGWFDNSGFEGDPVVSLDETDACDKTLYAYWANGESLPITQTTSDLGSFKTGEAIEIDLSGTVSGGWSSLTFAESDEGSTFSLALDGSTLKGKFAGPGEYVISLRVSDSLPVPQTLELEYTITITGEQLEPLFTIANGNLMGIELNGNTSITIPSTVTNIFGAAISVNNELKATLREVTIPGSVKKLSTAVFEDCTRLTSVTLESGVESIGSGAFERCTALTSVTIPNTVTNIAMLAFAYCSALESIEIPSSVRSIGAGAFLACSALSGVTIPEAVTVIEDATFSGCSALTAMVIPSSIKRIGQQAFYQCTGLSSVTLPDSVEDVGDSAFGYCGGLKSAVIGNGVTNIADGAFFSCDGLKSVTMGTALKSIGASAFWKCTSISSLTFPESLERIGMNAFGVCHSLTYVKVPKGVSIGEWAFSDCGLVNVNIAGEEQPKRQMRLMAAAPGRARLLAAEPEADPDATSLGKNAFIGCRNMQSATIGNKVNEIGSGAFAACPKLTTFNLESGNENYTVDGGLLLTIDRKSVVAAVAGLVDVTVPNGVTDVMDEAFSGHATLKSVVLPDSAKAIGEGAFSNATQFAVITIPSSVTAIGTNAFYGTKLATTYVATGDVSRVRGLITASGYNTAGVTFIEALSPVQEEPKPSIDGDSAATVTGNAEDGFVVTPSTTSGTVEVVIPSGIDAEKVTVEVPPTASVKPSGANVKVVKEANATSYDITAFLDIPAPNASGVIDLNAATVKPAIVKEALDPTKEGVDIDLKPTDPSITTAATRPGLTYTFSEGTSLEGMTQKATKVGDGTSWTPTITVKGGTSGFYSIGVAK